MRNLVKARLDADAGVGWLMRSIIADVNGDDHRHLCPSQGRSTGRRGSFARSLMNRLNGATAVGVLVARAGGARTRPGPHLLLLAEGYRWPFPTGGAFTVGDVVISRHHLGQLRRRYPRVLDHEERHSRQWMVLGPLFLPLYLLAMAWSWLRTGDRAAACWFEVSAGLADGGYHRVPTRPLGHALRELASLVRLTGDHPAGPRRRTGPRRRR